MKQILLLLLSISLVAGCERPKGFTLSKVTSSYGADPRWDVENDLSPSELAALLQGPYTYLGSGNHTYAFMSRDEKTVIKFFKQKHMRVQSLFLSSETKLRRAKERLESFSSYLLAYEKLRDETGLLYLHLNPTHHLHQTVTLIDQHGKEHRVNLDEMEFLIQKKATLSFDHLNKLFSEGAYDKAISSICSLLHLVAKRSQMGIYDKDLQFYKNFGFIENQAVEIDIGEFRAGQEVRPTQEELQELSFQLKDFIQKSAPEFAAIANFVIDKEIENAQ
ncbi:MAG: hypothetical protein H7A38_06475 [Chlamydiales bacterium]|nr:hypothetical protein [Chlamydiales bacterium]